jgi:nucleoside-diphosphate-sugar epimerase
MHYDPTKFDFGKRKAFPLRQQHFFADIHRAKTDLGWQPKYDLVSGLTDSYQNDYLASGRNQSEIDFSLDEAILGKI